ncbi:tripartite tricarboxylate transporter substrate binding protein [Acidovorax sp. sic0104]|uniref:Bug family tripartite tricarboxylate transporter substrate binding protein n=1 Tax=Acidovorax sp. sic0104 TaxID=2854784 RepID=UPI001C465580|nr:tripartite tricarboxylate transporter substrate binding protein [Acidovorax sp. sic0104]MBV7542920.1 tripartite tricarboxylate transporter substrate binding protein [Acidovorax sp. sic0104]
MLRKHFLATLGALALTTLALPAKAQDPKPLEWVVGYAAGGGSDIVARTIAESMSATLGRPIVINNKPGAGTNIAAEYSARHKDYGNLIFSADFATLAANPFLFSKLSYNSEKDFQPVGLLVRFPMFLVVSNNVPAKNLKEFMAWAKGLPDGVNWASAGPGSPHHLVGELFREQSGLKLTHVPYRGAAPAIQDVIGGQVPAMWIDSATVYPFLATGKVRAIGVASPQRVGTMPDVPTIAEQGLQGFEGYAWQGVVAPTGTPPEVVANFSKALQAALADTRTKARLQALGVEPMPGTAAQMGSFARAEREKWGRVITKVGVKLD